MKATMRSGIKLWRYLYKILDNNLPHSVIRIYAVGKLTKGDTKK